MGGLEERWPLVQYKLFEDLERLHESAGPWDLVIFTGDFVQSGSQDQFDLARGVLQGLWEHLEALGSDPQLVLVPGNHDLARPGPLDPAALTLQKSWDTPGLAEEFFRREKSAYNEVVTNAFAGYSAWAKNPGVETLQPTTEGLLPGDFSATYTKDDVRLGVLGINTTFLQLSNDMKEGTLAVDVRQLHRACANDIPKWISAHDTCLLLTHHPPSWLRPRAGEELTENVLQVKDNFALHLCGHLHEAGMRSKQVGGGIPTRMIQGASLYGRKEQAEAGAQQQQAQETRIHGYTSCELEFADLVTIRCWPRIAHRRDGGGLDFRVDQDNAAASSDTFAWTLARGRRGEPRSRDLGQATNGDSALPPKLRAALARRVEIYKRNLRYRFEILEVTDHKVVARLKLSYELVNATNEPRSYLAGLPSERPTKYIAANVGDGGPNLALDAQYVAENLLEFPVQLQPMADVLVSVEAEITYRVPDSESLATFVPSLDYALELVGSDSLRLNVQPQMPDKPERSHREPNIDVYEATHPVLDYQGLRLDWTPRTDTYQPDL